MIGFMFCIETVFTDTYTDTAVLRVYASSRTCCRNISVQMNTSTIVNPALLPRNLSVCCHTRIQGVPLNMPPALSTGSTRLTGGHRTCDVPTGHPLSPALCPPAHPRL